jgi:hypothetical protein
MFARLNTSRTGSFLPELIMLVVGINIALWFEGKFEDFRDARTEVEYLQGLADDLRIDIEVLDSVISDNKGKIARLESIIPRIPDLADASPEEQTAAIFEPSSYTFFEPSDFTYTSMRESGDFRLLSDPGIKEDILRLVRQYRLIETLQDNFIQGLDDSYIPSMMSKFNLLELRIEDESLLDDLIFRNFFAFTLQDTGNRIWTYESARKQASEVLARIEEQLEGG